MSRTTRFSVAVHVLALIGLVGGRMSSQGMAKSVGTNASFIRRLLAMLGEAGLVTASAGVAGAKLGKEARAITLLDVYRAVAMEDKHRLAIHSRPNPACFVGRGIKDCLEGVVCGAEQAFGAKLAGHTLADVIRRFERRR